MIPSDESSADSLTDRLDREVDPPPRLKRRVDRTLRARGLLASGRPSWQRTMLATAAALGLLLSGFALGSLATGGEPEPGGPETLEVAGADEPGFLLLLYEDADFQPAIQEAALVAEYGKWAAEVAGDGVTITGQKLGETSLLLESPHGDALSVQDRESGSPIGRLGGYFVLSTDDRAQALEIARSCPHLRHGGRILVRPIVPT